VADLEACRVILGSRHESGIRVGRTVPPRYPQVRGMPEWACLDCDPGWVEVHRLALEGELQDAKMVAVAAGDFEAAASASDREDEINDQIVERVRRFISLNRSSDRPETVTPHLS
jgi:hypothetical protein